MAVIAGFDNVISPAVFTKEIDQSQLAPALENIGGVIVGPFAKGPGFSPTTFTSTTDLENMFGVADGTYYAPYAAKQYLQEKGLVTVARVGSLTGYKQAYPFIIYAVKGTYGRALSYGALSSGSSAVYPTGSLSNGFSGSIKTATGHTAPILYASSSNGSVSAGTIVFTSASFIATFASQPGEATPLDLTSNVNSPSGSLMQYGKTVTFRFSGEQFTLATGRFYISSSATLEPTASFEKVRQAVLSGSFSGSLGTAASSPVRLISTTSPFTDAWLVSGSIFAITSSCATPIFAMQGIITGSFGQYNGTFTSNGAAPTFDVCTGAWTVPNTADYKVLAVLADTQNGPPNTSLICPGFSGSVLVTASFSGSNAVTNEFVTILQNTNSSTPYGNYSASLDASSTRYLTNVFGKDPTAGDPAKRAAGQKIEAAYLYKVFEDEIATIVAANASAAPTWGIVGSILPNGTANTSFQGEPMNFTDAFSLNLKNGDSAFGLTNAFTPWVVSQKIAAWTTASVAPTRFRLFRFHTLSDGSITNTTVKIEISNVKLAGTVSGTDWGTFTLNVRKYSDTDRKPEILETFTNLTLDPDSSNYIARRIGDRYNYINFNGKIIEFGTFANLSNWIRVEVNNNSWPTSAVPYGFEAYATPIAGGIGRWTPPMLYTRASIYGANPGKYPSGIAFNDAPTGADAELASLYPTSSAGVGAADDNKQYFAPLPDFGAYPSTAANSLFALDDTIVDPGWISGSLGVITGSKLNASLSGSIPSIYDASNEITYAKMRRFVFGFQGGFDGIAPNTPINLGRDITPGNTQGFNCTDINSAGSIAYKQVIGALSNADEWDINLIVTPGIIYQHHPYVTNLVVDMCEGRGDVFYIADLHSEPATQGQSGQINAVVNYAASFDSSYVGSYYPWIKILDTNVNKIVTVPPSVILPAVYAANDKIAAEWFAPAGLNRGLISIATQVTDRTTHAERDILYEGKVNPIAAFPGQGIAVFGQKTLQNKNSALNRINVRRLLINLKKFVSSTARFLIFEQNTAATRQRFLNIINPYLENVQQRSGLYAFQVQCDEKNNDPSIIDSNVLLGQIYLKPTKTAEFILIPFTILSTGAIFPTI
jgi:hypothetical protein